jgi:hypothetical protein
VSAIRKLDLAEIARTAIAAQARPTFPSCSTPEARGVTLPVRGDAAAAAGANSSPFADVVAR